MSAFTDALALSHVPRWVIVPHIVGQSVADHSFRTLVIFNELCDRLNLEPTVQDVFRVLYHDLGEAHSGDIPKPYKEKLDEAAGVVTLPLLDTPIELAAYLADLIEAQTFIERHKYTQHGRKVAMALLQKIYDVCPADWRSVVTDVVSQITYDYQR